MVLLVCTFVAILALCVYFFFRRKYAFWKDLCVPHIKPNFPLGSLNGVGQKYHFGELLKQHYDALKVKTKKLGFGGIYTFLSPTILVTDLDFVRRVLVADFEYFQNRGLHLSAEDDPLSVNLMNLDGDKWISLCKKLVPKFEPKGLETVLPEMLQVATQLSATLHNKMKGAEQFEISGIIERLTVDMTAVCAFKTNCNSLAHPNKEFKTMAQASFAKPRFSLLSQIFMLEYPSLADIFHVMYVSEAVTDFFLKLMGNGKKIKENIKDATAEAFTFFSAGFETTTSALTFTLYELALNPELQAKARVSVNNALIKQAGKLSYDSIREMTYLEQCVNETLRKYPPTTFLTRRVTKDYILPSTTLLLTKGMHVVIPVFAIHHDPDYWSAPELYDPDRFAPQNASRQHLYAFLGFGGGSRQCIGTKFAMLQLKISLATILKEFKITIGTKTLTPPKFSRKRLSLMPEKKIWVKLEKIL